MGARVVNAISTKRNREGHRALADLIHLHHAKESRMAVNPTPDPTIGVVQTPAPDPVAVAQAQADQAAKAAADAQAAADAAKAQAEEQAKQQAKAFFSPDAAPQGVIVPASVSASPFAEITGLVNEAVSDPTSRNIAAVVTWAGGTAVSFGLVSDTTEQTVASAILGVLAVVFMIVNAIHGQHRAKVAEAAVYVKAKL